MTSEDGEFPPAFLRGVATAAHQIEGGNVNSDWWAWEHDRSSGCADPSGDACDSFHRWTEDVDMVASMGLGAYRFSIEWSRIEPAEGNSPWRHSATTGASARAASNSRWPRSSRSTTSRSRDG